MSKLPFFTFFPLDWLRDTGGLSPLAKSVWIDVLAYAWNEPERGVYERSREAFCNQLRVDQKDLISLLSELASVASVTASNEKVTLISRRMMKFERSNETNRIRQKRFYYNAKPNAPLTHETLEVREKEKRKDVVEKKNEKEKTAEAASPAPADPKGPPLGPPSPQPHPHDFEARIRQRLQANLPPSDHCEPDCTCEKCFKNVVPIPDWTI